MKLKYALGFTLCVVAIGTIASVKRVTNSQLVVHEWGTFTSVQGGDGSLLSWRPLVTSELPKFVYDWQHAGLDRVSFNPNFANKGSMTTLQRMETPVVYFYSAAEQTVDLSVSFPQGKITEWFPQASQIGPSRIGNSPNHLGSNAFGLSLLPELVSDGHTATKSLIHWSDIHILPAGTSESTSGLLPNDASGSHYFAARDTDANFIRIDSLSKSTSQPEFEKFLFYRGAGSFATPLRVTMSSDDAVTVSNSSKENLSHLLVLTAKAKAGSFVYIAQLLAGDAKTVSVPLSNNFLSPTELGNQLSTQVSDALVKEGLYPREAKAMVNTWHDSWFAEDGLRVLYILPRTWTDRTLPMTLNPEPKELVRVMVGRAEMLIPALEQNLAMQLDKARLGDTAAANEVQQTVKALGRFAEPAFYRALAKTKAEPSEQTKLVALLSGNATPRSNNKFE